MAFQLELHSTYTQGSVLTGPEDLVPEGALRLGVNIRVDRVRGRVTSRPGQFILTPTALDTKPIVLTHSKLFGATADYGYVQVSDGSQATLYRLSAAWQDSTKVLLDTPISPQEISDSNWLDGYTMPWKFMLGPIRRKDNGTQYLQFGIDPPALAPASATFGARSELQIDSFDALGGWTGLNTTLLSIDPNFKQEGTGALGVNFVPPSGTQTPVAHTFGISRPGTYDLSSFHIPVTLGVDNSGIDGKTTSLIATNHDFVREGVLAGMRLVNTSSGATGVITSIGQSTPGPHTPHDTLHFTAGLTGGAHQRFDNGNPFRVEDSLSEDDDWMQFYFFTNQGYLIDFVQLDFGLDGSNFGANFFSVRLGPNRFSQGAAQWTLLRVRKSEFVRFGQGTMGWESVTAIRLQLTTTPTTLALGFGIDDLRMLGGYGIEGEVQYSAIYVNENTGTLSSPPKTDDEVVLFTTAFDAQRMAVQLDLSNIATSPDPQVTHLWIYRQSDSLEAPTFVAAVPVGTTSFLDTRSNLQLDATRLLEPDNDPPPQDAVLFGPGALQRFFAIHDRNKVRYSKAWQARRSRGENWPLAFEWQIGDGSQEALNGLVLDQTILVWSEDATWEVLGQGPDAFVPIPIPLSRGLAARWAVTSGDGQAFFLALDGVYSQKGTTQLKLTVAIDPFFLGLTIHGQAPLNRAAIGTCRLAWYPHPTDPHLVLLYPEVGSTTPTKQLILKRNLQSGQYTECFFDSTTYAARSVYVDPQALQMTYGSDTSRIYQAEVATAGSDAGAPIAGRVRLGASDQGNPRLVKTYSDLVLEANTGGNPVTVQAAFNRSETTITAGTVTTTSDAGTAQLPLDQTSPPSVLRRHNIALDLSWSSAAQVTLFQMGWHVQAEAEDVTFLDTGLLVFDSQALLRRLHFDYDVPTQGSVTLLVDGVAQPTFALPVSNGRVRADQLLSVIGNEDRGKTFRVRISAPTPFLLYTAVGEFEQEPLPVTYIDTREIPARAPQNLHYLFFDLEAPAAVTVTVYIDGVVFTTFLVGPTQGRQRLDQVVSVPGGPLAHGRVLRITMQSASLFQLWGLSGDIEQEPLGETSWDSRDITFPTPQILWHVLFDIHAPQVVHGTLYTDGVVFRTFDVGPTQGRERVDILISPNAQGHLARARTFRLTLTSAVPFQLWGLTGEFEAEPLPTRYWDSRPLPFVLIEAVRWYVLDIDTPAPLTIQSYLEGVLRDTRVIPATLGRQRLDVAVPASLKGRSLRVTASSGSDFQVWQWLAMTKPWGKSHGYSPRSCQEQVSARQERSLTSGAERRSEVGLMKVDSVRIEKAFYGGGG